MFDSLHRAGLADGPGCGQPEQGSNGATLLFDFYVPRESGWIEIVFDTLHKIIRSPCFYCGDITLYLS
jgi:hypothetical protein